MRMDPAERLVEERLTPVLGKASVNQLPVGQLAGRDALSLEVAEQHQVMVEFFLSGNLSEIARTRMIDYTSLLEMARQPWFAEEIRNLEREATAQLKVRLTKMLGKTLDQLENRLTYGDQVWRDQGLRTVPVPARDLAAISTAIFSKKKMIEDSENGFGSNEARRLLNLADALRSRQIGPAEIRDADILGETGNVDQLVTQGDSHEN